MAKKNRGLFSGLFDMNGDGKIDLGELFVAHKVFEECTEDDADNDDDDSDEFSFDDDPRPARRTSKDYSWRDTCEDGSEFDVDPEDYETEEEYEEALHEAKYGWRDTCEDGSEFFIIPEQYETEEEYEEALHEAKYGWRDTCEDGSEFDVDPEDYETEKEYEEALHEAKYGWRDTCEDGSEFFIIPEDYETEKEYEEALHEAKYGWRDTCEDGSDIGSKPDDHENKEECPEALDKEEVADDKTAEPLSDKCSALDDLESIKETDYPNKRRYNAARTLANKYVFYLNAEYERKLKERCRFILDRADTVLAADYLSEDGKFLYSQAIKDNFKLPISLPDEDETREYAFWEAIRKIAKKDIPLSFEVWKWALERFLPYAEYDRSAYTDLTSSVVHDLYGFPENYRAELVRYMDKNPEFCRRISERACDSVYSYANLLVTAIREELYSTASVIFGTCLEQAHGQWKVINDLTESTIICCKNDKEVESMEFFRDNLFPLVKSVPLGMVQDEVEDWEKKISEYIDRTERGSEKYAYSRRYAWRKSVPDGKEFDLNPLYYETEKEYLAALEKRKYEWREWYRGEDTLGIRVTDFETQEEFREAFDLRLAEKQRQEREQREKKRQLRNVERLVSEEDADDGTVYTICGVELSCAARLYSYRTDDQTLKIGDKVLVPAGNAELTGTVVSVGQFLRKAAPFPVEKMRAVIRKLED